MPETEIVLDTSGSINEILLKNFLRECKNILQHTKLKVGCFDTEFYGFHEIRTEEDIENRYKELSEQYNIEIEKIKHIILKSDLEQDVKVEKAVNFVRDNTIAV